MVAFTALDQSTTQMTVTEHGYTSAQAVEVSKVGLEQCLDKMGAIFGSTPTPH